MIWADLHMHTRFSDGTLTCGELLAQAEAAGLSCISVTDHDTVDGVTQAQDEGVKREIEVIPGVELTAEYERTELHILGYCIDHTSPFFLKKLQALRQNRVERIYEITQKLKDKLGIVLAPEAVFAVAYEGSTLGRLHVARALVKEGFVSSVYEAFARFIGDKSPAYVAGFKLNPAEAIALIKQAKGVPVLAHPYTVNRDALIPELVSMGLMGLEVFYIEHSQGMVNFYKDLAKKHNLLMTGGSDFHGEAKPDVALGSIKIPYELVEKLKSAKERLA
jgi:hypothetical protein